ncbi:MAG: FecR family protein [uncultured Aureispira sp.]|uniref:FecR family protein n=1 Tax=uncultured Aureispira sp. TaxID=1331704 RepID=A0A6S6RT26_9BACT|nr:MAG: FecR family protein [uncultured Aureispira sp.]
MEKNEHTDAKFEEQLKLFENMEVPYERTKKEVWEVMSKKMLAPPAKKIIPLNLTKWLAAAVIIIASTLGMMRFYTTTVYAVNGTHLACTLPDNSTVRLNAGSTISYAPYWWLFKRSVSLEGEAFFEVEKGSKFVVNSTFGYTEVLGTSFNIYARDTTYQVFCKTGRVGVHITASGQSIVLKPNEKVVLKNKALRKEIGTDGASSMGWIKDQFYFNNVNLVRVLEELERQYNVNISFDRTLIGENNYYTGLFAKEKNIQSVLEITAATFDLNLEKINKTTYNITPNY